MGVGAIVNRARYYRRSFGARQTALLYAARAARRPAIRLQVPGVARPVECRPTEPDRFTICHVFVERDYELPLALAPSLIVDAGANVGYASVYFANRFPDANIVALEPDGDNIAVARRNCDRYQQVQLLRAGLWPRDAALQIVDPGVESWAFQVREAAEGDADAVDGISIPSLLRRLGRDRIDILKLDIEGSEEPLFSSPDRRNWLPAVDVVIVETHGEAAERIVAEAMREASFARWRHHQRREIYVNPRLGLLSPRP